MAVFTHFLLRAALLIHSLWYTIYILVKIKIIIFGMEMITKFKIDLSDICYTHTHQTGHV